MQLRRKTSINSPGFTMIELLVSVMLLLMLTGLLVAGYNKFNSTQLVTQAGSTFKNNLRAIRTNARSGLKPETCDTLVGYRIQFSSVTTYASETVCIIGGAESSLEEVTYTLPSGIQFAEVPDPITFYTVNQGKTAPATIVLEGRTTSITISIDESGVIGEYIPTPTP